MAFPAEGIDLFFMSIYGGFGYDPGVACSAYLGVATGRTQPGNPPYTINDFLGFYPQFFGPAPSIAGTVTSGSAVITGVASITGIAQGQLVTGPFPAGTVVLSVATDSVTVSQNATSAATAVAIYETPPMPLAVIQSYIHLASISLMHSRWHGMWLMVMGLYVAHFSTLYQWGSSNAAGVPGSTALQALAKGVQTSKSVGDVSVSYEAIIQEGWGSWNLTLFGQQLITFAQNVGAGMIYVR